MNKIPFNSPHLTGKEIKYIVDAHQTGQLAGDGKYTKIASRYIEKMLNVNQSLITHSCTAALEMSAILLDLKSGDEVIMPSYTFVSTANAFVLRGATPVFVDVDRMTFNIDPAGVEIAITSKTKAIVVVHYAGVSCDIDKIMTLANNYGIPVIEDAAQALLSTYKGKSLGSFGLLASLSFHETKNIISGEGGALIINDSGLSLRAEIIREKGTNRSSFFRGEVDKYTWVDLGSSFLPGELTAAFLCAQLEEAENITQRRLETWNAYNHAFAALEADNCLRRQFVPDFCQHNAHMYYLVLSDEYSRHEFIQHLNSNGVHSVFHYVPLHSSPAGAKFGRSVGKFIGTEIASEKLVRLPMGVSVDTSKVIDAVNSFFECRHR